eukprot:CAMPEP_0206372888 /NCGR_PEP_ID=MMETSP0294-20121207/7380_1 /ASSEMBLY_ACC=CAM_ASM_000327 /TAXON_ID=39354 /ORGANISM="Heterosigma akashiwo, Strain CCMP2393" /LENGTH=55 /DNA_ID=CAMNT_0053820359 /DNA_START=277 /DNA_END=440 /DNA_ORIENTATION=+
MPFSVTHQLRCSFRLLLLSFMPRGETAGRFAAARPALAVPGADAEAPGVLGGVAG